MTKSKLEVEIHPTAVVEEGAQLGEGVKVGAYAYIGSKVKLGKGTVVQHHGVVEGFTEMGEGNEVFPFAVIGGKTHDLKYKGGEPGLKIGDRNVFREYVTVHIATEEGDFTELGDDNTILAYSHIAHDCRVGNRLVMSSHSALAGHVVVGDYVNIGWNVGVHQFCRLGDHSMMGGCSKIVQDVLPYMLADGNPAVVRTFNKVGIERAGYTPTEVESVKFAYQVMYRKGFNRGQALEALRDHVGVPQVKKVLEFAEGGKRGLL